MRLWAEEAFGPVASCTWSPPSTKPLALANNGEFGLGSAFWSSDPAEIDRVVAGMS